ncbi:Uma2 family endonuclease [Planktothricoides raciborskii]|uniref:Uma2 family endonuclease n=1 Tax=Planktothricoides raciborskii GIHE-MW2 TaxID=2792601 RepID=A0AAU8JJB3_9CYAN
MQLLEANKTQKRTYTPEEYLALEETAEYKSEYHDGEIIPMTGGTTNHNQITLNVCRKFPYTIKEQKYRVFAADVRLWIPATRRYVYPDVMVIQGKPIYQGKNTTTVTNPTIIVEVLSKSTEGYDKTDKFRFYRSISTFQEYILIDQNCYHIEIYSKTGEKQWQFTEYDSEQDVISLASVEFQFTLSELYEQVDFSEIEDTEIEDTEIED